MLVYMTSGGEPSGGSRLVGGAAIPMRRVALGSRFELALAPPVADGFAAGAFAAGAGGVHAATSMAPSVTSDKRLETLRIWAGFPLATVRRSPRRRGGWIKSMRMIARVSSAADASREARPVRFAQFLARDLAY